MVTKKLLLTILILILSVFTVSEDLNSKTQSELFNISEMIYDIDFELKEIEESLVIDDSFDSNKDGEIVVSLSPDCEADICELSGLLRVSTAKKSVTIIYNKDIVIKNGGIVFGAYAENNNDSMKPAVITSFNKSKLTIHQNDEHSVGIGIAQQFDSVGERSNKTVQSISIVNADIELIGKDDSENTVGIGLSVVSEGEYFNDITELKIIDSDVNISSYGVGIGINVDIVGNDNNRIKDLLIENSNIYIDNSEIGHENIGVGVSVNEVADAKIDGVKVKNSKIKIKSDYSEKFNSLGFGGISNKEGSKIEIKKSWFSNSLLIIDDVTQGMGTISENEDDAEMANITLQSNSNLLISSPSIRRFFNISISHPSNSMVYFKQNDTFSNDATKYVFTDKDGKLPFIDVSSDIVKSSTLTFAPGTFSYKFNIDGEFANKIVFENYSLEFMKENFGVEIEDPENENFAGWEHEGKIFSTEEIMSMTADEDKEFNASFNTPPVKVHCIWDEELGESVKKESEVEEGTVCFQAKKLKLEKPVKFSELNNQWFETNVKAKSWNAETLEQYPISGANFKKEVDGSVTMDIDVIGDFQIELAELVLENTSPPEVEIESPDEGDEDGDNVDIDDSDGSDEVDDIVDENEDEAVFINDDKEDFGEYSFKYDNSISDLYVTEDYSIPTVKLTNYSLVVYYLPSSILALVIICIIMFIKLQFNLIKEVEILGRK